MALHSLQDGEHSGCTAEMENAAPIGGDLLVVASARAEKGPEFVIPSTEPRGGIVFLEAPHTSDPDFDALVVLLEPVIPVCARPVLHVSARRRTDRARVGAVPVRGDAVGSYAGGRPGRAEEGLGSRHVAVLTQQGVDQITVAVDGTVEEAPAATNLQIGLLYPGLVGQGAFISSE